ncbi:MAG: 3-hydroxyacyl-CoA dehydrogenase/enoyl-CoA hydratase family protein [Candidatus Neomarinimicrobiota bacterium]|nr:3-hydroxyacyl-CoA dehydrogenase/enoyl-CoA hydratase family protein [Candidatus Neomarinimicrobiota bacterium]
MPKEIEKVAVLGAGTMGAQLAGHMANAGIPALLFDLSDELATKGQENLAKMKPAPLYSPKNLELVEACTYENDLDRLGEADWVLEAVAENLEIKHTVYKQICPVLKDDVLLSSNSSGLPVAKIAEVLPEKFQSRFVLTHFFNPPRYLRLVEIVPASANDEVVATLTTFIESSLGKGIVRAKDTPNFVANRIGVHGQMVALQLTEEMGLTVEEVDKLMGTIVGRPKSAMYRTLDIVGLDVGIMVSQNSYDNCPDDEERQLFARTTVLNRLVDEGRLGQKSGKGFYKKTKDGILSVDFDTLEYTPQKRVRFDGYRVAKQQNTTGGRIRALAYSDDKAGQFFWEGMARTFIYTANRIPEISDDIVNIDNAMKWGYGYKLGIFESWDAIGVRRSVNKMKDEGKSVPPWVERMLDDGIESFYAIKNGKQTFYSLPDSAPREISPRDKEINLSLRKSGGDLVKRDWSASLIDLGDDVLNVEFHSILQPLMNPIDLSLANTINDGINLLEAGRYKAMVIGHQGQNFCAGANLALILEACENKAWDILEETISDLQALTQRIRFSKAPIVVTPFGFALGGGYELAAPAAKRICSSELYMGLVEVGVGLIPGAGGNLRFILNILDSAGEKRISPFQIGQKALETIGFAKVSTSASHALKLGYLRPEDEIVMNRDHLIYFAKQAALEMIEGYEPPKYRDDISLAGKGGRTAMTVALKGYLVQGKISAHDETIAKKLAFVITGGDKSGSNKPVDEQFLLDIEREAFLALCGEEKTQDRIRHFLKKGKPLRN